jgi:hypothetical protein
MATASEWIAVVLLAVLFVAVVHTAMCARFPPPTPAAAQTVRRRGPHLQQWGSPCALAWLVLCTFRAVTRTRPCRAISNNRSQQVQDEDGDGEEFRYMSVR